MLVVSPSFPSCFHELISSREFTHTSSFSSRRIRTFFFSFLMHLPRVSTRFFLIVVICFASPFSPSAENVFAFSNLAGVNADVIVIVRRYVASSQGGARTQKFKTERRSRRGNPSEETVGALCFARLLIAVNTIVFDDRDR